MNRESAKRAQGPGRGCFSRGASSVCAIEPPAKNNLAPDPCTQRTERSEWGAS